MSYTFPLKDPLPGQFDWLLKDIRNGLTLPPIWPDNEDETTETTDEKTEKTQEGKKHV